MKRLLTVFLCTASIGAFASLLDSATAAIPGANANPSACMDKCDPGAILKALGKNASDDAKNASQNTCKVACLNSCFAGKINTGNSSEVAATACKDSLQKDLHLN